LHLVAPAPFASRPAALAARIDSVSTTDLADLPVASGLLQSVLDVKHDELDPVVALEKKIKNIVAVLDTKRQTEQQEAEQAARCAAEQATAELQEQLIEAAEQSGASSAEIASLCHMPISVPVAQPAPAMERPQGFSTSDQFLVEVTDLKALAQAVLESKAPVEVLQPNLKVLSAMAKALKGNLQLPGVSITRNLSVSGRKTK
jgi:hypothetical protein